MSNNFQKEDVIVYDNAGVCQIDDIKSIKSDYWETERVCYILRPLFNNKSIVYVPIDNEKLTQRMRNVMNVSEINIIIDNARNSQLSWTDDRRRRSEEFKKILSEKNQQDLIRLATCIYMKKNQLESLGKKLSTSDEIILRDTERFVNEEFAYSLGISLNEVEKYVTERLGIKK